jgi:hypothetical protein
LACGVLVAVRVGVAVAVGVGVAVRVGVGVLVGVRVGVFVAVFVAEGVGLLVGVAVGSTKLAVYVPAAFATIVCCWAPASDHELKNTWPPANVCGDGAKITCDDFRGTVCVNGAV